ncbi:cytochrome P450 2C42-like [Lepidochelys kempii]|uniref:cytochrome P450 2C42-like n=1 Tax=Lepidochelys kempii TaxID=8472 RepID=UPI003C6EB05D
MAGRIQEEAQRLAGELGNTKERRSVTNSLTLHGSVTGRKETHYGATCGLHAWVGVSRLHSSWPRLRGEEFLGWVGPEPPRLVHCPGSWGSPALSVVLKVPAPFAARIRFPWALWSSLPFPPGSPFDPTFLLGSAGSSIICCLVFGSRFGYKDQEFLTLPSCINQNFRLLSSRWGQVGLVPGWDRVKVTPVMDGQRGQGWTDGQIEGSVSGPTEIPAAPGYFAGHPLGAGHVPSPAPPVPVSCSPTTRSRPSWPLCRAAPRPMGADALERLVSERAKRPQDSLGPSSPDSYIDCFLLQTDQEKQNPDTEFTTKNLVMTTLELFFAGTETVSTTLRCGILLLMKYPEIKEKVHKEIDQVIGRSRLPATEDRSHMPYTDAVIHEVHRFADVIPMSLPHITTQDVQFRAYVIPKGTAVIPLLSSVLWDTSQFKNLDVFDPRHFLDGSGHFQKSNAFMPFSAGKWVCLGEGLVRMELFLFTTVLQRFALSSPVDPQQLSLAPGVSNLGKVPQCYQLCLRQR